MLVKKVYALEQKINSLGNHTLDMVAWHTLRFFLNVFLPLQYRFKMPENKRAKPYNKYISQKVIISMTTFPARIKKVPVILDTLMKQTVRADKIILWLASSQFKANDPIVDYIRIRYQGFVEIQFCEDIKSHKKYFFALQQYPDACIVTIDDDIFYPEDMLERLLETYQNYPNCIVAMRAHQITLENGIVQPYNRWNKLAKDIKGPDMYLCATSGGGCLFPPGCLSDHVFDIDVFRNICINADDIWLKCMSYMQGTKVVLTGKNNPEVIDMYGGKSAGLAKNNVSQRGNDEQFEKVTEYYHISWGMMGHAEQNKIEN